MQENYQQVRNNFTHNDIIKWAIDVTRTREFDRQDYDNQVENTTTIYDVPSTTTDIKGTEKVGDIAVNSTHLYTVIDNSGSLEWRRVALSTF
jgi:hypothetical protein